MERKRMEGELSKCRDWGVCGDQKSFFVDARLA